MSIFNINLDQFLNIGPITSDILYESGNENQSITGGWSAFAPSDATSGACIIVYDGENKQMTAPGANGYLWNKKPQYLELYWQNPVRFSDSWANAGFRTENLINLSGYTKLHIKASAAEVVGGVPISGEASSYCVFGVTPNTTQRYQVMTPPPGQYATITPNGETELDISSVNSGYIYFGSLLRTVRLESGNPDRHVHVIIEKIWLTNDSSSGGSGGGSSGGSGGSGGGSSGGSGGNTPQPVVALTLYDANSNQLGANNWDAFAPTYYAPGDAAVYAQVKDSNGNETSYGWHSLPVGCSKRSNGLEIYFKDPITTSANGNGAFGYTSLIDVTNYSRLIITAAVADSSADETGNSRHGCKAGLAILKAPPAENGSNGAVFPTHVLGDLVQGRNEYDISNYSGQFYIYFGGASHNVGGQYSQTLGWVNIRVTKVELE